MASSLRVTFKGGKQLGAKLRSQARHSSQQVVQAYRAVADSVAADIMDEGRADIASAGNFGSRWTEGFLATVNRGGGSTVIRVTMAVPYWTVFQFGATINGKPMLWIPLSFAEDAKGVRAKDYPGPLFRVDRKSGGAPLLLTTGGVPKYFGKESVTIPKKFSLIEITRKIARTMGARYKALRQSGVSSNG